MPMQNLRRRIVWVFVAFACLSSVSVAQSPHLHTPPVRSIDEKALREYTGVYQWGADAFVYLQIWSELTATNELVAFDECGDLRVLYPTQKDSFFAGPGAAVSTAIESRVEF